MFALHIVIPQCIVTVVTGAIADDAKEPALSSTDGASVSAVTTLPLRCAARQENEGFEGRRQGTK